MAINVNDLMNCIKGEATEDKLFESSGLTEIVCAVGDKVLLRGVGGEVFIVKEVNEDENKYLVVDSEGEENWVTPGEVDKKLEERKKRHIKEGKVPNPKATTTQKIKDLKEEDDPVVMDEPAPKKEEEPKGEEPKPKGKPVDTQREMPTDTPPEATAAPAEGGEDNIEDLVSNMSAAMEHFEKGNYKVAQELLKLISDSLKKFKEEIKAKRDAEKAAEAPRPAPGEGTEDKDEKKKNEAKEDLREQDYTTLAKGISDEEVAKKIAAEKRGIVVKDENDDQKFMVIMKEAYTKEDVEGIITREREAAIRETAEKKDEEKVEESKKRELEEAKKEEERKQQRIKEEVDMMLNVLSQATGTPREEVDEAWKGAQEGYLTKHSLKSEDMNEERLRTVLEQLINSYKLDRKEALVDSLGELFKVKAQSLNIDEKKSQLLDELLKKQKENE